MSREQNVPLLLWISTAILAHIATGGGANQIARVLEDRSELQWFARTIRGRLQPPQAIEVAFENLPAPQTNDPAEPSGSVCFWAAWASRSFRSAMCLLCVIR